MPDIASREWRFYLEDMIEFARKALAYTEGMTQVVVYRKRDNL